jgi:hypothetical protein
MSGARYIKCETCGGSGEVHSHNPRCWDCNGRGVVRIASAGEYWCNKKDSNDRIYIIGDDHEGDPIFVNENSEPEGEYKLDLPDKYRYLPECDSFSWVESTYPDEFAKMTAAIRANKQPKAVKLWGSHATRNVIWSGEHPGAAYVEIKATPEGFYTDEV